MSSEKKRHSTLCWDCRNACGGCSWSRYKVWQPVPGWTAVESSIPGNKGARVQTFIVLDCPEFIPDKINDKEVIELPRMKWTPELKHDAIRMKEEGLTAPQIAERLGVTPVSVYSVFKDMKRRENKEIGGGETRNGSEKAA